MELSTSTRVPWVTTTKTCAGGMPWCAKKKVEVSNESIALIKEQINIT